MTIGVVGVAAEAEEGDHLVRLARAWPARPVGRAGARAATGSSSERSRASSATITASRTVRSPNSRASWKIRPIPSRARPCADSAGDVLAEQLDAARARREEARQHARAASTCRRRWHRSGRRSRRAATARSTPEQDRPATEVDPDVGGDQRRAALLDRRSAVARWSSASVRCAGMSARRLARSGASSVEQARPGRGRPATPGRRAGRAAAASRPTPLVIRATSSLSPKQRGQADDVDGAEDRTGDRAEPTDDDHGHHLQRQLRAERRGAEADPQAGEQRTGEGGDGGRQREGRRA